MIAIEVEHVVSGDETNFWFGPVFEFAGWTGEEYVLFPGAVYDGNRFEARPQPYSPRYAEADARVDAPAVVTEIPRLATRAALGVDPDATSHIDLLSGDCASPAVGVYRPTHRDGILLFYPPTSEGDRDNGVRFEEFAAQARATLTVQSPGVRRTRHGRPASDSGQSVKAGDRFRLRLIAIRFPCAGLSEFFDAYLTHRCSLHVRAIAPMRPLEPCNDIPLDAAVRLVEAHYDRDSWRPSIGLYATDCAPTSRFPYQIGWCGGAIATLPLMVKGEDPVTRQRAHQNLATTLDHSAPGGLLMGRCDLEGRWTADFAHDATRPHTHRWTLVRRQGDALYFIARQLLWLRESGHAVQAPHQEAVRRLADALVTVWAQYGQYGHFLDQYSGEIAVGNSCSGGIIPAAMCAAAELFGSPSYLDTAIASAKAMTERFLSRGITTGGPGDALQCPDSESVAALMESFMCLHDATGDREWINQASNAASQFSTWVMAHDHVLPADSEFGRLGLRTSGSVFANAQNKHSAPGICTHSGVSLLKLYRATRDQRYIRLLADVAQAIPRFISRPDRPIHDQQGRALPSGWINERVNTSDWDNNVGGVFYGSCWCEVSLLLTALEIPSVYVGGTSGEVYALDNVVAHIGPNDAGVPHLHVQNPSTFDAVITVLQETDSAQAKPLGWLPWQKFLRIALRAGESVTVALGHPS